MKVPDHVKKRIEVIALKTTHLLQYHFWHQSIPSAGVGCGLGVFHFLCSQLNDKSNLEQYLPQVSCYRGLKQIHSKLHFITNSCNQNSFPCICQFVPYVFLYSFVPVENTKWYQPLFCACEYIPIRC